MRKALYALISLSLSGCVTTNKPICNNATPIVIDRSDIITISPFTEAEKKFSIKPTKFTRLIKINAAKPTLASSFSGIEGYEAGGSQVIKPKNVHEMWMKQIQYNTTKFANMMNGKKQETFDLTNIPLSFSHRFELDKPRKKAKCIK